MKSYKLDKIQDFQYLLTKEDHYSGSMARDAFVVDLRHIDDKWEKMIRQIESNFDQLFKVDIDHVQK